ncbi:MarR family transcriptional regulator [Streptomyces sp. NBC_01180]|uniref:MarR family transcriptional regulator n=1 Tax=Streptomyces sp. NBC_01180 TaxID=2903763 RepID=UPI0038696081|nr:MarR family transcriptional regulator [Streptomyces sp. NBC_01180]
MAVEHFSPALSAPASPRPYPMAKPGYGKHSAPNQLPRCTDDFTLLPERERYIAGFVDHLPEGAAMNVKSLAKQLPLYGQQAISTALTALSVAGHLRRVRRLVGEGDQVRWVFRTFWSRTARDNEWWAAHLVERDQQDVREGVPSAPVTSAPVVPVPTLERPTPERPTPDPAPDSSPSPAYLALAQLGRNDARLALSAVDCAALEGLAADWLARGVNTDYLTRALSAGLPSHIASPVGFVRRRLTDKIPPALPAAPVAGPGLRLMVECTRCGTPGRAEALPDGLCRPCHRADAPETSPSPGEGRPDSPAGPDVRAHAGRLRELLRAT